MTVQIFGQKHPLRLLASLDCIAVGHRAHFSLEPRVSLQSMAGRSQIKLL